MKRVTVPPHVVFRDLAQETVLLNVQTGQYHGVGPTGSRFFTVMREALDLAAAAEVLISEFAQPRPVIETDLAAFCAQMQQSGLVELADPRR